MTLHIISMKIGVFAETLSFHLEVALQVLIPKDDVVGIYVLVGVQSVKIRVDLKRFSIVGQSGLSWALLKLIIKIFHYDRPMSSHIFGTILKELILISGNPEQSACTTILSINLASSLRKFFTNVH